MPASNSCHASEHSSVAPASSYLVLLRQVLAAIADEAPGHYAMLCQVLAGTALKLRIASESALLLCRLDELKILSETRLDMQDDVRTLAARGENRTELATGGSYHAELELRVAAGACSQLLNGELRLLDALRDERVWVRAPAAELHAFSRALRLFLMGASSSASCRPLFARLHELDATAVQSQR